VSKRQTIAVRRDFDVIVARSRVRDLARNMGLGPSDQARISLATSSVARVLGMGESCQGEVIIESVNSQDRACVRVTCTCRASDGAPDGLAPARFADARSMTDEMTMAELPAGGVQVTLVKWV
jgi:hypothetical protein